ncbi:MAG: hypothetical protein KDJ74_05325 [Notoacmeibacter sp.]|nr:hypothetical protein [Notoacmeibacter sp.]
MPRLLTFVTCFFWLSAFTLMALTAAGHGLGQAPAAGHSFFPALLNSDMGLALGYGLAACGFLWAFATVIFDNGDTPGDVDTAVTASCAAGILVLAASLLVSAGRGETEAALYSIVAVIGLLATANTAHSERRAIELVERADEAARVASRMALGAAHDAMLSRISGRPGSPAQGEER